MNKEKIRLEELNKKTCKDCYHYEKCYFDALKESHLTGNDYREIVCIDNQIICKFFKDKSLIIELPCKVGKEIYVMNRGNIPQRMISDKPDIRCHCAKEDNLCMALCDDKKHGICAYRLKNDGSDIGEKVFLTKEEAEAKLKELNNND